MQVVLPLTLFCQLVVPQQTAQHKLTLEINRAPPLLVDLFEDLVAQNQVIWVQSLANAAGRISNSQPAQYCSILCTLQTSSINVATPYGVHTYETCKATQDASVLVV